MRCSDLGVVKLVVEAVQAWILASHAIKTMAQLLLRQLSLRVQQLVALIPNAVVPYGLFLEKGPMLQGAHWRYAAVGVLLLYRWRLNVDVLRFCFVS